MPNKRAPENTLLTFPLPKSLKADIRNIAAADCSTMADWVRATLKGAVRRHKAAKKAGVK